MLWSNLLKYISGVICLFTSLKIIKSISIDYFNQILTKNEIKMNEFEIYQINNLNFINNAIYTVAVVLMTSVRFI